MGIWGCNLYDDDYVLDIKNEYLTGLRNKVDEDVLINKLLEYYVQDNSDENEKTTFFIVMLDLQWKYGRSNELIKKYAYEIINDHQKIKEWASSFESYAEYREKQALEIITKVENGIKKKKKHNKAYYV